MFLEIGSAGLVGRTVSSWTGWELKTSVHRVKVEDWIHNCLCRRSQVPCSLPTAEQATEQANSNQLRELAPLGPCYQCLQLSRPRCPFRPGAIAVCRHIAMLASRNNEASPVAVFLSIKHLLVLLNAHLSFNTLDGPRFVSGAFVCR